MGVFEQSPPLNGDKQFDVSINKKSTVAHHFMASDGGWRQGELNEGSFNEPQNP